MRHPIQVGIAVLLAVCVGGLALWRGEGRTRARAEDETSGQGAGALSGEGGGTMEQALFGAGCFWGVESTFRKVKGVTDTAVGYAGGTVENPTYEEVCTDKTGHTEVVRVEYDPDKVSYDELLQVFWKCHDPTQVNRQGPDVGRQYRSVIFPYTEAQKKAAEASREKLEKSGRYRRPIATEIAPLPAPTFWRAEEYHQRYHEKHGGGCRLF